MSTLNPKPYFGLYSKTWNITEGIIPLMIEAFKTGIFFYAHIDQFRGVGSSQFEGWCEFMKKGEYNLIRVSNDERRRILRLLANISKAN
jgi:hypothetical protein